MIQLRNVEKYFEHGPTKTFVLRRINVDIKEGEFVSIMGPSGAGKSTLLHVIGMHDSAWTGEYRLLDFPIHSFVRRIATRFTRSISDSCSRATTCSIRSPSTRTWKSRSPIAT